MSLSSTGPSGPAQNGLFNKHVFGKYRVSSTDAVGNVVYKKVEPYKNTTQHFFIHKNIKLHTDTWLVSFNWNGEFGILNYEIFFGYLYL